MVLSVRFFHVWSIQGHCTHPPAAMESPYSAVKCLIYVLINKTYVNMDWILLFLCFLFSCCREICFSISRSYFWSVLFSGSITSEAKIDEVHANVWVGYLTEHIWRVISFFSETSKLICSVSSNILKMQCLKLVTRQIQWQIGRAMGRILQHCSNFTFLV